MNNDAQVRFITISSSEEKEKDSDCHCNIRIFSLAQTRAKVSDYAAVLMLLATLKK